MTPTGLAEAVSATEGVSALRETADAASFIAPMAGDDRAAWLDLRDAPPACLTAIHITDAEGDTPLERGLVPVAGERWRVTLQKARAPSCLQLVFAASMKAAAEDLAVARTVRVAEMRDDETFSTLSARYQAWTDDPATPFAPAEPLPDPRGFVKDFTSGAAVPSDVRPWIMSGVPTARRAAFAAWRAIATERLLPALADQVSIEGGVLAHHFAGPPRQVMSPSPEEMEALADGIQMAAAWVYGEGRDAEARHLLLSTEWARAYRPDDLGGLGARSLESAKAAYAAFVHSGSKETLRALAELRKAVIEETQKASQRAQDISGALWKDLVVASAPLVLKVLPDSAKAANVTVSAVLAWSAAAFLAYSFGVQAYINHRYFAHQGESRTVWRHALNAVLSQDELDDFSETPIRQSLADYRAVRNLVGVIYAAIVASLVSFGIAEWRGAWAPADETQPAAAPSQTPSVRLPSGPVPLPMAPPAVPPRGLPDAATPKAQP